MSTANIQLASTPLPSDLPFYNYGVSDIPANTVVILDAANTVNNAVPGNTALGAKLPATGGNPSLALGVTMEILKVGQTGRVRTQGIAIVTCDGAVTAGAAVDASPTVAGAAKAHVAAKNSLGQALISAADTEQTLVLINPAPNA